MFDPALPQEGTPLDAVQMRSQLNGLKALIDAIATVTAAQVDGVSTLNPGEPATAQAWFDGNVVHFTFGLPRGADGVQGPPGEVSAAQLASAIGGTSSNSNGVATLGQSGDSSYNPQRMQDVLSKLDELILALRR